MFCHNCGKPLEDIHLFCPFCGTKREALPEADTQPETAIPTAEPTVPRKTAPVIPASQTEPAPPPPPVNRPKTGEAEPKKEASAEETSPKRPKKKKGGAAIAVLLLISLFLFILVSAGFCALGVGVFGNVFLKDFNLDTLFNPAAKCVACDDAIAVEMVHGNGYCAECMAKTFCSEEGCNTTIYKGGLCKIHYNDCVNCMNAKAVDIIDGDGYCESCKTAIFCCAGYPDCYNKKIGNAPYCAEHCKEFGYEPCEKCGLNYVTNGKKLCGSCSTVYMCTDCGESEALKANRCKDCFDAYFGFCHQCGGSFFEFGNYFSLGGNNRFCEECYNDLMN